MVESHLARARVSRAGLLKNNKGSTKVPSRPRARIEGVSKYHLALENAVAVPSRARFGHKKSRLP